MIVASPSDLLLLTQNKVQAQQQQVVFDFVVVGAGSAGCVVAARLAEDPHVRVLLVEAGTRATERDAQMPLACGRLQQGPRDWSLTTECSTQMFQGLKHQRFPYPRGKCLGGSSILNYMAYVRGSSNDYDTWERDFGATGWGWKHGVLPFFIQSERNENLKNPKAVDDDEMLILDESFHGTNGPLAVSSNPTPGGMPQTFVRGAQELLGGGGGRRFFQVGDYNNGDNENKVALFQQTISKGKRCDTATAYIFNQPSKPNLTILTNAQATRLLFDETDAKKVVGVELADLSLSSSSSSSSSSTTSPTTLQVHASKEVILSAGAIGSPQLLLLSGIGPTKELEALGIDTRHNIPHVGKNLEEHPAFPFLFAGKDGEDIGATNVARAEGIPRSLPSLFNWLFRGKGLHATSAYDATLFYKTNDFMKTHGTTYGPNAQIGLLVAPGDELHWQRNFACTPAMDFGKTLYTSGPDPQGVVMIPTLLHSYSRGSITLASKNPLAKPNVTVNLLDDDRDMVAMVAIMRKCLELAQTKAMKSVLKGPVFPEAMLEKHGCTMDNDAVSDAFLVDFIRHYSFPLYHPTSTCKIGKVVDPQLQVLGLKGVRVADASVFPTNISGNTNAPSIMVGEKAADIIKKEYSLESTNVCTAPAPSKVVPWMMLLLGGTVVATAAVVGVVSIGSLTGSKSRR